MSPDNEITIDVALDIARRSNATYVVLGSFAQAGQKTRIDVHAEDLTAKRLASETITVDRPDDVLTQVDLLAWKLARHFTAGLEEPHLTPAAGLTTNLDAYRYYSLGLSKAIAYHNQEAIELFKRALELDPKFLLARARIGYVYAVTSAQPDLGRPYLDEVFQSADQLRESDRLLIRTWHAIANLDYPAAITSLRQLIALYPYEVEAYDRLAHLLGGEGRHAEGIEIARRGLLVDAESSDLQNTLGNLYGAMGQHADSIAARQRFVSLAPNEPNSHDSLGLSYQMAGRYEEAEAAYLKSLSLKPDFDVALIHLANTYAQTGRYRAAVSAYETYVRNAASPIERIRGCHSLALMHSRLGQRQRARELAVRSDREGRQVYGPQSPEWSRLVLEIERGARIDLPSPIDFQQPPNRGVRESDRTERFVFGWSELRRGHTAVGLEQFRLLPRSNPMPWHIDSFDDVLGNAHLGLGRWDDAIAEYERILRSNPRYPRAHYFLGLAHERKGDASATRRAFEQFVSVWGMADPDVPELVDAKARLARLTH